LVLPLVSCKQRCETRRDRVNKPATHLWHHTRVDDTKSLQSKHLQEANEMKRLHAGAP
jgi:hypothetical protein